MSSPHFEVLYLWYLGNRCKRIQVGELRLLGDDEGVSLHYSPSWLKSGFALSKDLPLVNKVFFPPDILFTNSQRAAGAVDDARPDRWGEKVIRFVDKPERLSLMEFVFCRRRALWSFWGVNFRSAILAQANKSFASAGGCSSIK